ncbi:MAG: hypothetical protein H5T86_03555 [Armatimonadetes bacterium]|nr:hypothetical protein [Armatimonadota bacterium]
MRFVLVYFCLMAAFSAQEVELPQSIGQWHAQLPDRVFNRQTLYDYIDGGAELYLAYDFRQLVVRTYIHAQQPPIIADVFDMGSSADAFGVFSAERFEPEVGIGQGSEYASGMLRFWKGRYFVCVSSRQPQAARRQDILAIGQAIADAVRDTGPLPHLLDCLPPENLRTDRIVFFHTSGVLSYLYFVSQENILGLGSDTSAVLAQYLLAEQTPQHPTRLLVVEYPSVERAAGAEQSFIAGYLNGSLPAGAVRIENGLWCTLGRHGRYLAVVFDAPSREAAVALLAAWRQKLQEVMKKWQSEAGQ